MPTVDHIVTVLEALAPPRLAEDWDNVGLLVGDRGAQVERLMTCLTLTPASVDEATRRGADLVVAHHPLPFRPLRSLATDATEGRLLWQLARAGVSVYSAHTAFDSAANGINQQLATGLGLASPRPLAPDGDDPQVGAGRVADAPDGATVESLAEAAKKLLNLETVRAVGKPGRAVRRVAIACGSGGSLLDAAIDAGCDAFFTGEATFHTCLAAEAAEVTMLLVGHYASERFAMEALASELAARVDGVEAWASEAENDPLRPL